MTVDRFLELVPATCLELGLQNEHAPAIIRVPEDARSIHPEVHNTTNGRLGNDSSYGEPCGAQVVTPHAICVTFEVRGLPLPLLACFSPQGGRRLPDLFRDRKRPSVTQQLPPGSRSEEPLVLGRPKLLLCFKTVLSAVPEVDEQAYLRRVKLPFLDDPWDTALDVV